MLAYDLRMSVGHTYTCRRDTVIFLSDVKASVRDAALCATDATTVGAVQLQASSTQHNTWLIHANNVRRVHIFIIIIEHYLIKIYL